MDETTAQHRSFAVDLFNHTWELIDKPERTQAENDEMIHSAHASRYHWGIAGTAINLARGEWQISRVYTLLGRTEPALYHARRSLELCQEHGFGDFDLAYAYEAMARASRLAGDQAAHAHYRSLAAAARENIAEEDDREFFDKDLATL